MEKLDQNYGYILYRTSLEREQNLEKIRLGERMTGPNIFVEGKPVTTLYDRELLSEAQVKVDFECRRRPLDILMENMGRVNFGPRMESQRKGIDGCVQLNGHMHYNWEMYPPCLWIIWKSWILRRDGNGGNLRVLPVYL